MPEYKKPNRKDSKIFQKYATILGIKINSRPKVELLNAISLMLKKKIQFYIVTPNPEIILQAQSDPDLTYSLNSANISLADGVGLKIADKNLQIIKGREFMVDLLKWADTQHGIKVYFLGSTPDVNKKAVEKVRKMFPNINVRGNSGPTLDQKAEPVSEVDIKLQSEILDEINNFKPDFLFVAFGAPKQEKWVYKWLPKLKVIGAMAVGLNLEWLLRLKHEPHRFPRIFSALILFPLKLAFDKVLNLSNP